VAYSNHQKRLTRCSASESAPSAPPFGPNRLLRARTRLDLVGTSQAHAEAEQDACRTPRTLGPGSFSDAARSGVRTCSGPVLSALRLRLSRFRRADGAKLRVPLSYRSSWFAMGGHRQPDRSLGQRGEPPTRQPQSKCLTASHHSGCDCASATSTDRNPPVVGFSGFRFIADCAPSCRSGAEP
jgi:hypothetical protein